MKFLIDMPISPFLAEWLEGEGHNTVHAAHIGLSRASDEEIMTQARNENCIIVTADLDYPRILALAGSSKPGIILFRGGNYNNKEMLGLLKRVLATIPGDQMPNSIVAVDKKSIRRRQLPI